MAANTLLMVAPGHQIEKNQFRIEVFEQAQELRTSLLDTEFSLPDKERPSSALKILRSSPIFTLRVEGRRLEPAALAAPGGRRSFISW